MCAYLPNINRISVRGCDVGKHIHKLADFLCIRYRLIKRRAEIVAAKNSEVRIVALCIFIAVPVYHGKRVVVVILLLTKPPGFWQNVRTLFVNGSG